MIFILLNFMRLSKYLITKGKGKRQPKTRAVLG
jgi:hypothetical protein